MRSQAAGRCLLTLALLSLHGGCSRATLYTVTGPQDGGKDTGPEGGDALGDGATPACPSVPLGPGNTTHAVQVAGVARSYVLHVPAAYNGRAAVPLVLDFHGIGGTGATELAASPYPARLDGEGVIMAFPDGLKGTAGTAWNIGPCCVPGADDVAFSRAVVADVESRACVDAHRVYAVGVLTGGGMAHYLGCQAADLFAAIAPAAFDLLAENVSDCHPARPITEVSFRGTAPSRVPYEGGPSSLVPGMPVTFLGAVGTFDAWAKIDGCPGTASAADANGCAHYSSCSGGAEVILCTKSGGGEDPGDPAIAWPVLLRHSL